MKNQEEKRLPDKLADGLSGIMIIICVIIFAVMVFAVSYGVIGRYIPFIKNPRWTSGTGDSVYGMALLSWFWLRNQRRASCENDRDRIYCAEKTGFRTSLLCLCIVGGSQYHVDHLWTQLLELTKRAKMSATGWPMGITYLSVVVGGIYGLAMSLYRVWKGGF